MYYVLQSQSLRKVRHLNFPSGDGWGIDFLKGLLIEIPQNSHDISVNFECDSIDLPDYFEADGAPIVNESVLKALQIAGVDNYQQLPLIINFNDRSVTGYSLINVIGRINCMNKELSDFSTWGKSVARIFNLKLDESKTGGALMFREHNYHDIIFICEQLKIAFDDMKITGCEIIPADGWSDSSRF